MAVTIADIQKLRKLTGAGMSDCKKALEETNNDIDAAVEAIRAKGKAVAAKRSDVKHLKVAFFARQFLVLQQLSLSSVRLTSLLTMQTSLS